MDTTPLADDAVRCGNTGVGARRAGRILEAVTRFCHSAVMWCEAHGVLDWFTIGPLDQFVK